MQDAVEARRKAEAARRANPFGGHGYGQVMISTPGIDRSIIGFESVGGGSSGFLPPRPASDVRPRARMGRCSTERGRMNLFQVLRGQQRQEAISAAMTRGIITGQEVTMNHGGETVETVTVRLGGYPARHATQNEDGTYKLNLGGLVFPKVLPTGDVGFGFGEIDTATFRIAPQAQRPAPRPVLNWDGSLVMVPSGWSSTRYRPSLSEG